MSKTLAAILEKAKINARRVNVLGSYAHIDTFEKYEAQLLDLMTRAGFSLVFAKGGLHLDGVDGFRMVFKLK